MKKRFLLASIMGSTLFVLSGCTSNELGVTEYNATPDVTVISLEQNKETQPETADIFSESAKEILSTEVINESSTEIIPVEILESEVDEADVPVEIETTIETQNFTHYDVQNAAIEDERIQQALSKTIDYLKVNNQFFDTAEYHFTVSEGSEMDTILIEVSQRRADGLDVIGRYAYNYAAQTLDPYYK